jgi:hypothetical protein
MKLIKSAAAALAFAAIVAIGFSLGACEKKEKAKVGDIISFGKYNWRVLDVADGKALVITEGIIEERRFDENSNDWASSEIRGYLNNEFYNSFSADEKKRIASNDDKIFLLSKEEAEKYFSGDSERALSSWWMLRSPVPNFSGTVYLVFSEGIIDFDIAVHNPFGVRPALWLK